MVSAIAPTARVNMKPPESTLVRRESDSPRGRKLNLHESTQSPAVHRPTVSSLHPRRLQHGACSTTSNQGLWNQGLWNQGLVPNDFEPTRRVRPVLLYVEVSAA